MDLLSRLKGANLTGPPPADNASKVELLPPTPTGEARRVSVPSKDGVESVLRRRSTFKGLATTIQKALAFKKLTKMNTPLDTKPTVKYQNTFKMEPDMIRHFNAEKVEKVILTVLENYLANDKYEARKCPFMTRRITELVKNKVKQMNFIRYKLVCNVMLGQCNDQGLEAVSRCVWDSQTDGFACIHYKNDSLFVVVTIYGVYFE